jgi:GNAT superfamily N-acetyltransferase
VRLGLDGLGPDDFVGFHRDWALQMDEHRLWRTLQGSETVAVAFVEGRVAGYAAAIGDGATFAFVTSIEVREEHRGRGLGTRLLAALSERYVDRYALDLVCDESVAAFYEAAGFRKVTGMVRRNYTATEGAS